jgi:hypothetical protein
LGRALRSHGLWLTVAYLALLLLMARGSAGPAAERPGPGAPYASASTGPAISAALKK